MYYSFTDVYIQASSTSVGPMEYNGPLQGNFDCSYASLYCTKKTFEEAEQQLMKDAIDRTISKSNRSISDLDMIFAGDLMNQLSTSHFTCKEFGIPFFGMYAACATSSLLIGMASLYIQAKLASNILVATSSHVATAERQFRFPNEYGIQKKETTTTTVTGAGAMLVSNEKSRIKVSAFIPGKIIDWGYQNANDMGIAMAPAAYDTLVTYLQESKQSLADFDCVLTGDLSYYGLLFLKELMSDQGYSSLCNLYDCGLLIFDRLHQDVFAGGSGCACSMCVTIADVFKKLESREYRRVLVLATGALLSPVTVQQKRSIPCIAHGIVYERCD